MRHGAGQVGAHVCRVRRRSWRRTPWSAGSRIRPSAGGPGRRLRRAAALPAFDRCPQRAPIGFATLGCSSVSSLRRSLEEAQEDHVVRARCWREADRPDRVCRHEVGAGLQACDDAAGHGKRQHTSTAVAGGEIHPAELVVVVDGGPADVVDATRGAVVDEGDQVGRDIAGVDRLEAHTLDRDQRRREALDREDRLDQVVELRDPDDRVAEPGCGQCFLDPQLGLVIGHRDAVDPDDRHVDDVGRSGAARGGDEVGGGDDVLAAGALGGAMDDGVDAVQRGVDALAAEQVALRPMDAGVADVRLPAQRADFVAGLGGFTDHSVSERAGRAGDENVTGHR